jgi:hypothetical protein
MKLRLPTELRDRAKTCAKAVDMTLGDWVSLAWKQYERGKLDVGNEPVGVNSTSACTVIDHAVFGADGKELRRVILAAVEFAEARNGDGFKTNLREGVDYVVANWGEA